jgi:hypothetical protein
VDAAENERSSFAKGVEGGWNDGSGGGEDDGCIELDGRLFEGVASPLCTEIEGEALVADVARHRIYLYFPVERDLNGQVSCGAETIETKFTAGLDAREAKRAKSDYSSAQQWGGLLIRETLRNRVDEIFRRDNILGVSAIDGVPGECGVVAQILVSGAAIFASAIGVMQPGDSQPGAWRKLLRAWALCKVPTT